MIQLRYREKRAENSGLLVATFVYNYFFRLLACWGWHESHLEVYYWALWDSIAVKMLKADLDCLQQLLLRIWISFNLYLHVVDIRKSAECTWRKWLKFKFTKIEKNHILQWVVVFLSQGEVDSTNQPLLFIFANIVIFLVSKIISPLKLKFQNLENLFQSLY